MSAHAASQTEPWYVDSYDEKTVTIIQDCLNNNKDRRLCSELEFDCSHYANPAMCQAQAIIPAWSAVGKKIYERELKKNPQHAKSLKQAQEAWWYYVEKQCAWEADAATYGDDDEQGNHPPYYDFVTKTACTYVMTVDRVISLHKSTFY